jgi:hypothetical protein
VPFALASASRAIELLGTGAEKGDSGLILQLYLRSVSEKWQRPGPKGPVNLLSFRGLTPLLPPESPIYNCSTKRLIRCGNPSFILRQ